MNVDLHASSRPPPVGPVSGLKRKRGEVEERPPSSASSLVPALPVGPLAAFQRHSYCAMETGRGGIGGLSTPREKGEAAVSGMTADGSNFAKRPSSFSPSAPAIPPFVPPPEQAEARKSMMMSMVGSAVGGPAHQQPRSGEHGGLPLAGSSPFFAQPLSSFSTSSSSFASSSAAVPVFRMGGPLITKDNRMMSSENNAGPAHGQDEEEKSEGHVFGSGSSTDPLSGTGTASSGMMMAVVASGIGALAMIEKQAARGASSSSSCSSSSASLVPSLRLAGALPGPGQEESDLLKWERFRAETKGMTLRLSETLPAAAAASSSSSSTAGSPPTSGRFSVQDSTGKEGGAGSASAFPYASPQRRMAAGAENRKGDSDEEDEDGDDESDEEGESRHHSHSHSRTSGRASRTTGSHSHSRSGSFSGGGAGPDGGGGAGPAAKRSRPLYHPYQQHPASAERKSDRAYLLASAAKARLKATAVVAANASSSAASVLGSGSGSVLGSSVHGHANGDANGNGSGSGKFDGNAAAATGDMASSNNDGFDEL